MGTRKAPSGVWCSACAVGLHKNCREKEMKLKCYCSTRNHFAMASVPRGLMKVSDRYLDRPVTNPPLSRAT